MITTPGIRKLLELVRAIGVNMSEEGFLLISNILMKEAERLIKESEAEG